jgi:hypothetical protein
MTKNCDAKLLIQNGYKEFIKCINNNHEKRCFYEFAVPSFQHYESILENSPLDTQLIGFSENILFYNIELCCEGLNP